MKKIWKTSFEKLYRKIVGINDSPQKIARGVAIGIFWGIMPTFGLAIIFSVPTAILLRANKFSSILSSLISNPLTTPFFLGFGYKIGEYILNSPKDNIPSLSWEIIKTEYLWEISKSLLIGTTILATTIALSAYVVILKIIQKHRRKVIKEENFKKYSRSKNGKNNY